MTLEENTDREETLEFEMNEATAMAKIRGSLHKDTRGLSTVEYLIILVLIAVAGITVWKNIGTTITTKATTANTNLTGMGG